MKWKKEKGNTKIGFIMLAAIPIKMFYILIGLFLLNKHLGLNFSFFLNFILVYLLLLYLSIFIGVRFLSKK